jgi:hypothetical protein
VGVGKDDFDGYLDGCLGVEDPVGSAAWGVGEEAGGG